VTRRSILDDRPIVRVCRICQQEIPKTETAYLVWNRDAPHEEWGPWCAVCAEQQGQIVDT